MVLEQIYKDAKDQYNAIGSKCVVGQWAVSLDEKDKKAFDLSLNDDDFSTRSLYKLYTAAGATFGLSSLRDHRQGSCACR
jgi:hypothetical protein